MLFGALAGLGAALAIPALSLGPAPGRELFTTSWAPGKRLVDINGVAVRAADLPVGSITTVFPEGDPGSARAQTLLIRVATGELRLDPDRLAGRPRRLRRLFEGVHARRLPGGPLPRVGTAPRLPLPPIDVRRPRRARHPSQARPGERFRSCRSRWPTTARSRRSATFRSQSGRRSGTSPREGPTARTTPTGRRAPDGRGARRRTAPGRDRTATDRARSARRMAR